MSERSFGNWLCEKRIEGNISQKQLCEGICSLKMLSKIELGERIPDIFLWECLLERLGVSTDEFEVIVFDDEYEEIAKRDKAEAYIEKGELQAAKRFIEEECFLSEKSSTLQQQYYYQLQALLECGKNNFGETIVYLKQALECVHPNWKSKEERVLLSVKDMECICMLIDISYQNGEMEQAQIYMEILYKYLKNHKIERRQLLKIAPKSAYLLEKISYQKETEILKFCQETFALLVEFDSILFLAEIMEILITYYKKLNLEIKLKRLEKQLQCLQEVSKEFGGNLYISRSPLRWFQESRRKQYLLCSEIIKGERTARNIKREELIEGIYENAETLARVENGTQNPSHKRFQALMERLHLPMVKYNSHLITDKREVLALRERIVHYLSRHEFENAKIELEALREALDCENPINQQYIMKEEAAINFQIKQINAEEFNLEVLKALKLTYAGDERKLLRIPTLEEARIINYIAISYKEMGQIEKGMELQKKLLECYDKSKISDSYNDRCRSTIMRNYICFLEISGDCEKAISLAKAEIQSEFSVLRGGGIDFMCSELVCVYEQMDMEKEKKKSIMEKYFRFSFYISDLFLMKANNKAIDKYYRKNFNPDVKWYE